MNKTGLWTYVCALAALVVILGITIIVMSGFNTVLLFVMIVIFALMGFSGYIAYKKRHSLALKFMDKVAKSLDVSAKYNMARFPLPVVVCNRDGVLIWRNNAFIKDVMLSVETDDNNVSQFFTGKKVSELSEGKPFDTEYRGKNYTVYLEPAQASKNNDLLLCYFIDNTDYKNALRDCEMGRPVFMMISVDGIDESSNLKDSEKAGYLGAIENIVENWVSENSGLMRKTDTMRFICFMQEEQYKNIIEKKFDILDRVRNFNYNGISGATLSIGLGRGKTLPECDDAARQAFDMAIGRGGDQAAVKYGDTFEFFGGVSKGVEKRTKVRIRVVASELKKLIKESGNVLVMGHKYSDLDSMGASIAMCSAARAMGKRAYIVVSQGASLATQLIELLKKNAMEDMLMEPDEAIMFAEKGTLLIVVDTHVKTLLESVEVYDRCEKVVVIDHHRKAVGHIDRTKIFHHEPFSSSACEMVTELLQYMGSKQLIGTVQAEALLSGIMLDTKNFTLKTGVRTFEAAAYLRSNGADTVAVRRLFSSSKENYEDKNRILANAKLFGNFAISSVDFECNNIRIVSAQAADEMLNINGIRASFVIYKTDVTVNISARSYGEVNVQLIMEKINGGGHQTMAATQLQVDSLEEAEKILIDAIKEYMNDIAKN